MSESIDNKVFELRTKFDVTQEELGRAVNVSRQTIIAIEKGNYIPSLLLALKLSKYFGVSVERLFQLE